MTDLIAVPLLFAIFINGIHSVFGVESEMFPQFNEEMQTIDRIMSELDHTIQTAINENANNPVLLIIQGDFISTFHEVVKHLKQLRDNYIACCQLFEPVYAEYLQISKDAKKIHVFRRTANTWKGKVMMIFRIEVYMKEVQNKVIQLADDNSIFYMILNEVQRFGSARSRIKWKALKKQATDFKD
ncbi:uncharacterized protein LOC116337200 [Contarinia nasturtii]|uniref:uncharacterized protein LOC116337200 n=1 Tax=Contarinia nasturtii TaxID=265458 RepID=UPI0012D40794|nr:uncharacterized protein LOC116337200 [Contarinia nasturtii]